MIQGPQTWLEMLFKDFIPYLRTWDSTLTWSNVLRLHLDLISISGDLTWTWLTDSTLDKDPIWWLQVQLGLHSMNLVLTLTCSKDSIWDGLDLKTQNLTLTWSDVSWIHLDLNLCLCVIPDVLGGYNGTIFAYGQTSSGKTHTMEVSVPQTLYCYCCLSIDKPRSQSHRVNPVTFISSSRLHQRITAQQALCNRLTANSKSSQEYTMAELWGIKRLKAESFLYQEGSNFLQTRMNSLFF